MRISTATVAVILGIGCALGLSLGSAVLGERIPEAVAQLVWLAIVLGGSAACGYRTPERAWRWGAVIVGVQPPCVLLVLLAVGELTQPSRSTGGMAAVVILAIFLAIVGPVAMLASYLGGRVGALRQSRQGAAERSAVPDP